MSKWTQRYNLKLLESIIYCYFNILGFFRLFSAFSVFFKFWASFWLFMAILGHFSEIVFQIKLNSKNFYTEFDQNIFSAHKRNGTCSHVKSLRTDDYLNRQASNN